MGANGTIACAGALLPWPLRAAGGGRDPASAAAAFEAREGGGGAAGFDARRALLPRLAHRVPSGVRDRQRGGGSSGSGSGSGSGGKRLDLCASSPSFCEAAEFNAVRGRCRLRGAGARAGGLCSSQRETHVEADQSLVEKEYDEGAFEAYLRREA